MVSSAGNVRRLSHDKLCQIQVYIREQAARSGYLVVAFIWWFS